MARRALLLLAGLARAAADRVALCVVGELRTFSMPFVHRGLRKHVVDRWDADVFFVYHEHYKAGSMARNQNHREGAAACAFDQRAVDALGPRLKVAHRYKKPDNCTATGSQWRQVHTCFELALHYAKAHDIVYDVWARTRPDFGLFEDVFDVGSVTGNEIHAMPDKSDVFFAMRTPALHQFLAAGKRHVPCDDRRCCLEMREPFRLPLKERREIKGGLVRNHLWMSTWPGWRRAARKRSSSVEARGTR